VAPCDNSAATAKVVGAFITAMDGPYPGREFFQNESAVQCVEESDYYFFPSPEGWEMGDRRVFCLLLLTY
jgi:hypothetical protein